MQIRGTATAALQPDGEGGASCEPPPVLFASSFVRQPSLPDLLVTSHLHEYDSEGTLINLIGCSVCDGNDCFEAINFYQYDTGQYRTTFPFPLFPLLVLSRAKRHMHPSLKQLSVIER